MTVTTNFFQQPRLREAVTMQANGESCVLRYRDEEYEIEVVDFAIAQEDRVVERPASGHYAAFGRASGARA